MIKAPKALFMFALGALLTLIYGAFITLILASIVTVVTSAAKRRMALNAAHLFFCSGAIFIVLSQHSLWYGTPGIPEDVKEIRITGRVISSTDHTLTLKNTYRQVPSQYGPQATQYQSVKQSLVLRKSRYQKIVTTEGDDLSCRVRVRKRSHQMTIKDCVILKHLDLNIIKEYIERTREKTVTALALGSEGLSRGILAAMLLGNQSALHPYSKQVYREAGIYHLLVVSGLHIGLVALFFMGITSLVIRLWPQCVLFISRHTLVMSIAVIGVTGYMALIGWRLPAVRAYVLFLFLVACHFLGRRRNSLYALLVIIAAVLMTDPKQIFSLSFQLTMVATFGVLLSHRWVSAHVQSMKRRWVRGFLVGASVSLGAFVFVQPLLAAHFNTASLYAVPINLAVSPVMGWILIPLGMLAIGLAPWSLSLASALFHVAATIETALFTAIESVSILPGNHLSVNIPVTAAWLWIIAVGTLLTLCTTKRL